MMKKVTVFWAATILALIILLAFLLTDTGLPSNSKIDHKQFHIGVSFCGNSTAEAELLVDRVKDYTNLLIIQSGPVSNNETCLSEIVDYAVAKGLDVIPSFGWFDTRNSPWQLTWINSAKAKYGDRMLGIYYYDEPGGQQIDYNWKYYFSNLGGRRPTTYQSHKSAIDDLVNGSDTSRDYASAANVYIQGIERDSDFRALKNASITVFTSDYALYWFTYDAGWDVLLAQIGWNDTITQDLALIRGAATMQNKQWGSIFTWKYDQPPYLDTGREIYNQMVASYRAGANYAIIFDYPTNCSNPYGVMTDEHFQALQSFWNDITTQKITRGSAPAEAVLVLPDNYGWGMRNVYDRIWYWGSDELSPQIWNISRQLLMQYGTSLDIVYDDSRYPLEANYSQVYYWNQTL